MVRALLLLLVLCVQLSQVLCQDVVYNVVCRSLDTECVSGVEHEEDGEDTVQQWTQCLQSQTHSASIL